MTLRRDVTHTMITRTQTMITRQGPAQMRPPQASRQVMVRGLSVTGPHKRELTVWQTRAEPGEIKMKKKTNADRGCLVLSGVVACGDFLHKGMVKDRDPQYLISQLNTVWGNEKTIAPSRSAWSNYTDTKFKPTLS